MRQKSVSIHQIQKLDQIAIEQIGIPSAVLMENAGRKVANAIKQKLLHIKDPSVCVFCGLGNNGGDGFVVARHLLNSGIHTNIYIIGKAKHLTDDALVNYQILKRLKYTVIDQIGGKNTSYLDELKKSTVVVDAIFGVGLNRNVEEPFATVIQLINKYGRCVFSVDIPSGLNGDTGEVMGFCVKAHRTLTFSFAKKGFYTGFGPEHIGLVNIVDIGIPKKIKRTI